MNEYLHLGHAVSSESGHDDGMVGLRNGETSDGDITVSDCFNFEDASLLGYFVERRVQRFQ